MKTNKKVYTKEVIKPGFIYYSREYLKKENILYLNIVLEEINIDKVKTCWMFGEHHGEIYYYFKDDILEPLNNGEIVEI